jgi:tetratricopeptide (TPR) repeat protein
MVEQHHAMKHKDVRKLMKRNELKDILTGFGEFFKKNSENLMIAVVVLLVIVIAIPVFLNNRGNQEQKAQNLLAQANYFYTLPVTPPEEGGVKYFSNEGEKYDRVINAYSEILQNYKGTKAAAESYLGIANSYYNQGKLKEAMEYFNSFTVKYPKDTLVSKAISGRAYCNYQLGNYREAIADWQDVTTGHKNSDVYFDSKMHMAMAYEKLKEKDKAKSTYEEIVKEGPDTDWGREAKARIAVN